MAEELAGRTAMVTGGSSDIGAAIVRSLVKRGADVAIHYHRNAKRAAEVAASVHALGRRAWTIQADLSLADEAKRVAAEASALAPIDILVNNAGTPVRRVHWTELDAPFLDTVFGLNYRAPLYLCQSLTPGMIERGRGVVVNILSTAAVLGGTDTVYVYASAKGALLTLTRALARSLAPHGVRVLAVAPGTIDTEFQRTGTSPEMLEALVKSNLLGRMGRPEEIGEVVAFMTTDAAGFVVGETIHVNGGFHMS
jgi:NAD(P)-dependent dehydrogenase (short-subunit alcohol dehydrogenase family)